LRKNLKGLCKVFYEEEGWGWISVEGEVDVWVHFANIQGDGFKSLIAGEAVSFNLEETPILGDQSRRALNVEKLRK
jgi:cold shock protein